MTFAPPTLVTVTRRALDFLDRGEPESARAVLVEVLSVIPLDEDALAEVFAALPGDHEVPTIFGGEPLP